MASATAHGSTIEQTDHEKGIHAEILIAGDSTEVTDYMQPEIGPSNLRFFVHATVVSLDHDLGISELATARPLSSEEIVKFMEHEGWRIIQRGDLIAASYGEGRYVYKVDIDIWGKSIRAHVAVEQ